MIQVGKTLPKENQIKLKQAYMDACSDKDFREYVEKIDLSDEALQNYTTRLEEAKEEYVHCRNCSSIEECKNLLKGHVLSSKIEGKGLNFSYEACPYYKSQEKKYAYQHNITCFDLPKEIKKASFKDVYKDDKNRLPIIKYFKEFIDSYEKGERKKGIYLHGSFGSGKTYLIAALFNELAKKEVSSVLVYYPELLRSLKASFGSDYDEKYEFIKKAPLLLLDDIGAENTTAWSRDEVLGPILQYRMDEHLPTFFTSNLTMDELENNLSITNYDKVKAKRIIERINQLSIPMALISKNRRN